MDQAPPIPVRLQSEPDRARWESIHRGRAWGRYPNEIVVRHVMRAFSAVPHADRRRVQCLDLGCGNGANSWMLAREGFSVVAVDISSTAVERAASWIDKELPTAVIKFQQHDCSQPFPWPESSFDLILDCASLCCLRQDDWYLAMSRISKLLTRGGIFISIGFSERMKADSETAFAEFPNVHLLGKPELSALSSNYQHAVLEKISYSDRGLDFEQDIFIGRIQ